MTGKENRIYVKEAIVEEGRTIRYRVEYGAKAARYFSGKEFFVQYDRPLRGVPEGILMIPLLSNLLPVAWAAGADVYVDKLDRAFHESLLEVKAAFGVLYPRIKFSGELHVRQLTDDRPVLPPTRSAAFFSGGVDSLGTFLRRKEENPYLITIWGGDIGFHQPHIWHEVRRYNQDFAHANGMESLFIKSSLRTFLNEERIAFQFGRFTHGWWPGLQHGIGMVGLCAPLAYALRIGNLYVPSALPPKLAVSIPDGSNTLINNRIRWAGAKVQLEGEELTRQDKVALIADFVRSRETGLTVRVCWSNKVYGNCGRCEKCSRTIAALMAEGIDPAEAGFPMEADTRDYIRQQLPGWLGTSTLRAEYWNEIRLRSMANVEAIRQEDRAFFGWFRQLDLKAGLKVKRARDLLLDLIPHPLFLFLKRRSPHARAKAE